MIKLKTAALALCAMSIAGAASANEHEIQIGEGGFFPQITYLAPGDTVVFINASDGNATASAVDDSWTSGDLAMDEAFTLVIGSETGMNFVFDSASFTGDGEGSGAGSFSFDPAPLN